VNKGVRKKLIVPGYKEHTGKEKFSVRLHMAALLEVTVIRQSFINNTYVPCE
jgi:hypothetical protein